MTGTIRLEPGGASPARPASVRAPTTSDWPAMVRLHDDVFGPGALVRTAYRIRERAPRLSPFCLASELDGALIAAVRFTRVTIGSGSNALLLGPLCVATRLAGQGYGKELVAMGLEKARNAGIRLIVLVGAETYYGRFGFRRVPVGQMLLPGPVDLGRLLAAELEPGSLAGYRGMIAAVR